MSRLYLLYENQEWLNPLINSLSAQGVAYQTWPMQENTLDLDRRPPAGLFYSRMSASAHTRGHRYAPELTAAVLTWLEHHGKRVINGSRALQLELSKVAQHATLTAHDVRTPRTVAANSTRLLPAAARQLGFPLITKHNRAGKGLGVALFHNEEALNEHIAQPGFDESVDGITLLQEYIRAPEPYITRVEFVGQQLLYAVRVDTSEGFELCPADACELSTSLCATSEEQRPKFRIIDSFEHPLVKRYQQLMQTNNIEVASFEFIVDRKGRAYTYDINTNTNYNTRAEQTAGVSGMDRLAAFLAEELKTAQACI